MPFGRVRGLVGRRSKGKRKVNGYLTNNSIKHKRMYAALRRKGHSKTSAAKISNSRWRLQGLNANSKRKRRS